MTYVMANPHGELTKFREMLEIIKLKKSDILYVLGDTVDYGSESIPLLVEMSMMENLYPVAGEHDLLALRMLGGFEKMLENGSAPEPSFIAEMTEWSKNGGEPTLAGFRELDADMREGVLDYLSDFSLYEEVEANSKEYLLVHAGIGNFQKEKDLEDYGPEDFFTPAKLGDEFFRNRVLVVGHTPTKSGKIERSGNLIFIDCGVNEGGKLGCLCLENNKEYYV